MIIILIYFYELHYHISHHITIPIRTYILPNQFIYLDHTDNKRHMSFSYNQYLTHYMTIYGTIM